MKQADKQKTDKESEDGFARMRWIPLVLEDMREFAAERDQADIAREIADCNEKIKALLALADLPEDGPEQ